MSSTKRTKRDVNRAALQVAEHLEKKFKLMLDNEELPSGVKKEDVEMHLRAKLNEKAPMGAAHICENVVDAIGRTKIVRLNRVTEGIADGAEVVVKLEYTNPGLSVKDRAAKGMILDAEKKGKISPDNTVICELTGGNTGIGLSVVAASRGYRCICVVPKTASIERSVMNLALGSEVVYCPWPPMSKAVQTLRDTLKILPKDKVWYPAQWHNPANPGAHYETTGPEIWEQCGGKVDVLVAGSGTSGTICGAGKFLREKNPDIRIVVVEPWEVRTFSVPTVVLEEEKCKIEGIGLPFIPHTCDFSIIDEVIAVKSADAIKMSRLLACKEGLAVGISAGANAWAALTIARRPEMAGKRIVTTLADTAERYLSTELYSGYLEKAKNIEMAHVPDEDIDEEANDAFFPYDYSEDLRKTGMGPRPGFQATVAPPVEAEE